MMKLALFLALFGLSFAFRIDEKSIDYASPALVDIKERPYSAAILKEENGILNILNGGSIISKKHILTIAGENSEKYKLYAKVGTVRWGENNSGQMVSIKNVVSHSEDIYDVAVAILEKSLTLGPEVQIIPMVNQGAPNPGFGNSMTFSGWGMNNMIPHVLTEMKLKLRSSETCKRFNNYDESKLCSSDLEKHISDKYTSFEVFAGSPTVYEGKLYGVSVKMYICDDYLGVSHSVALFREWIDEIVSKNP